MARRHMMLLAAGLLVVSMGGASKAQSRAANCAQISDPRGDVLYEDRTGYPVDIATDQAAGWQEAPLDILSVRVSAERQDVITTMHVVGIAADPVRGYVWRVWLTADATHPRETMETIVRRVTGADTFTVHYEWWGGKGPLPRGPVGSASGYTEDVPATGTIDAARGLIQVRIPMTLLDRWHISRSARIWDLRAQSNPAAGVVVGPINWDQMHEGHSQDDARSTYRGRTAVWRLSAAGC
jgi:hypothetical protein